MIKCFQIVGFLILVWFILNFSLFFFFICLFVVYGCKRSVVVVDDIFCIFVGTLANIADLRHHYGLQRQATEAMIVVEAYKALRDRGPYPPDQVVKDLDGKFAFIIFDARTNTLFAARVSFHQEKKKFLVSFYSKTCRWNPYRFIYICHSVIALFLYSCLIELSCLEALWLSTLKEMYKESLNC